MDEPLADTRLPTSDADVIAIVRLLGDIGGMTQPLPDRRAALLSGLVRLIDADVWMWIHTAGWGTDQVVGLGVVDGGWLGNAERAAAVQATCRPDWDEAARVGLDRHRPTTWLMDESHTAWPTHRAVIEDVKRQTGLQHLLFSTNPMPGGLFSNVGVHRRAGRPAFTWRELAIVHLVLGQADWLHYIEPPPIIYEEGLRLLTPREREILLHLIGGEGRKQIAAKTRLSEHTVGDYMKSLYRRLNVGSRAELMVKFLPAKTA